MVGRVDLSFPDALPALPAVLRSMLEEGKRRFSTPSGSSRARVSRFDHRQDSGLLVVAEIRPGVDHAGEVGVGVIRRGTAGRPKIALARATLCATQRASRRVFRVLLRLFAPRRGYLGGAVWNANFACSWPMRRCQCCRRAMMLQYSVPPPPLAVGGSRGLRASVGQVVVRLNVIEDGPGIDIDAAGDADDPLAAFADQVGF
jgi:hypothetical protein